MKTLEKKDVEEKEQFKRWLFYFSSVMFAVGNIIYFKNFYNHLLLYVPFFILGISGIIIILIFKQ